MEPNNIDKEFRNKLNQREIDPSANAWDRLDAMLTVAEQEKPVRKLNWLYMAASIIAFLLVGTIFFTQGDNVPTNNPVVLEQISSEQSSVAVAEGESNGNGNDNDNDNFNSNNNNNNNSNITQTEDGTSVANKNGNSRTNSVKINNNQVAENSIIDQNQSNQNQSNQNQSTVQPKSEKLINQNDLPKVDELLAVARSNPAKDNPVRSSVKVNAQSLLSQVDGEVDLTFREKVLRKVGKNYQNVKVALSNRNIEDENH
ncbi:MAG TPA: hypothetical protein VF581_03330 [Flavobacterium sp.]|jgi:hypothetical protein